MKINSTGNPVGAGATMTVSGIPSSKISDIYRLIDDLERRLSNEPTKEERDSLFKTLEEIKARLTELSDANDVGKGSCCNWRALDELQKSEEKYHMLFTSMIEGFALVRVIEDDEGKPIDYRFLEVNPAFERLTGFSKEEVVGKSIWEPIPDIKPQWIEAFGGIALTGELVHFTDYNKSRDRWYEIYTYSPARGLVGIIFTDVTKRKLMEDELRRSEEKTRDLIRHAPTGIYEIDFCGPRLKSVNDVICQYLGYTREELLSMNPFDLMDDKSKAIFQERIRKSLAGEEIDSSVEYKVKAKDGREYFVILDVTFTYKDGRPEGAMVIAHDITERKRAEEALRLTATKYSTILETVQSGFWLLDMEGRLLEVNDAYCRMSGYSRDELLRMRIKDLEAKENQEDILARIKTVCECGHDHFESHHRRKDGTDFDVDICSSYLDIEGGRFAVFIWDISARKQAEQALQESEQRFRDAIDNFPNVFVIYDANRRIKYVNSKGLEIIGCTEQEVVGRRDEEIFPPEMIDSYLPALKRAVETKTLQTLERTRPAKMGGQTIIVNIIPLLNEHGEIRQILGISYDISERKKAERALCASEEKMRLFFERQVIGAAITTPEKGWLQVNDKLCQMLGYPREELANLTWAELTHPEDLAANVYQFNRMLSGLIEGYSLEKRFIRKDGQIVHTHLSVGCVRRPDRTVDYVLALLADITERKLAEEELCRARDELELRVQERTAELREAKDAAEEAARAKAAFMANMSHELRTPMNAVLGMTSILMEEPLAEEHKECLETIRNSGNALLALINDVLDFSKLDREKAELELQPFDLRRCVEEALDLVAAQATEKGLDLAYTFGKNVSEAIVGDPARLRQILANLLSNAVKFTVRGEVVVSLSADVHCKTIHFEVADTGIGIPQDQMGKLFLPFSQVDSSLRRSYDGTGLGLAISRKLVEMMGGNIWVESKEGISSTFHFTIPVEIVPNAKKLPDGPQPKFERKHILIVDDNRAIRRILGHQVYSWGMTPMIVASGQEALDLVRAGGIFDIAILDLNMPDINGVTLAEEIRKCRKNLPVVALASVGQRPPLGLFAASLTKPIKPAQLHDALTCVLTGQSGQTRDQAEKTDGIDVSSLRILLAEDNVSSQKVALKMLEMLGFRADLAANGVEVLQALERQPYDLVLMDVKMPEMDGLEATRQIRQRWPGSEQPKIIAVTAYSLEGDRETCLAAGMDGYISKPVKMNELEEALSKCASAFQNKKI